MYIPPLKSTFVSLYTTTWWKYYIHTYIIAEEKRRHSIWYNCIYVLTLWKIYNTTVPKPNTHIIKRSFIHLCIRLSLWKIGSPIHKLPYNWAGKRCHTYNCKVIFVKSANTFEPKCTTKHLHLSHMLFLKCKLEKKVLQKRANVQFNL